mgnify:FL=1
MPHWLPLPLSSATTSHSGLRCPGQRGALGRPSPRKGARHPFEEPTKRPPPRPGALRGAPAGALLDCPCPARHPRKAQAGSRTPLRRWPRSPSRRLGGARCGATAPPKVWRCVGPGGDPPPGQILAMDGRRPGGLREALKLWQGESRPVPVSYTHLTLPTIVGG